jgi:hypothetical protein
LPIVIRTATVNAQPWLIVRPSPSSSVGLSAYLAANWNDDFPPIVTPSPTTMSPAPSM